MRTKILMTFFYIMLLIFIISMGLFIFAALEPGKYEMGLWCSTVGYVSGIIMVVLLAIKRKREKQE